MLSIWRYNLAGLSFFFVINIRKGSGSLQVIIGGSGNRPSMLMFGGSTVDAEGLIGTEGLRKSPGFPGTSILGLN